MNHAEWLKQKEVELEWRHRKGRTIGRLKPAAHNVNLSKGTCPRTKGNTRHVLSNPQASERMNQDVSPTVKEYAGKQAAGIMAYALAQYTRGMDKGRV